MNEILKDAPCLCKEDWQEEAKTTMKLSFGEKIQFHLLRLQKSRFAYPVMYDDGTVSTMKCDKIGRTPIGVIFEKHLLSLKISQNKMPWNEAMEYCKSVALLGKECEAGTIGLWNKIRDRKTELDKIFSSLGVKIPDRLFWTSERSSKEAAGFWLHYGIYGGVSWDEEDEKYGAFPILDLSDEYAYPVMYADGTISTLKSDKAGRMPLGVIFENYLITLKISPFGMTWPDAMEYCKSIKIKGEECEAGTTEFWSKCQEKSIRSNIISILSSLGGDTFGKDVCWTSNAYAYWSSGIENYYWDECFRVRPVLNLSKAVSKRQKLVTSL